MVVRPGQRSPGAGECEICRRLPGTRLPAHAFAPAKQSQEPPGRGCIHAGAEARSPVQGGRSRHRQGATLVFLINKHNHIRPASPVTTRHRTPHLAARTFALSIWWVTTSTRPVCRNRRERRRRQVGARDPSRSAAQLPFRHDGLLVEGLVCALCLYKPTRVTQSECWSVARDDSWNSYRVQLFNLGAPSSYT